MLGGFALSVSTHSCMRHAQPRHLRNSIIEEHPRDAPLAQLRRNVLQSTTWQHGVRHNNSPYRVIHWSTTRDRKTMSMTKAHSRHTTQIGICMLNSTRYPKAHTARISCDSPRRKRRRGCEGPRPHDAGGKLSRGLRDASAGLRLKRMCR